MQPQLWCRWLNIFAGAFVTGLLAATLLLVGWVLTAVDLPWSLGLAAALVMLASVVSTLVILGALVLTRIRKYGLLRG